MIRTTISLRPPLFKALQHLAKRENRSTPNIIETMLIRCLENDIYVDEFEMQEIRCDRKLKKTIQQSLSDYKRGRGHFVS